MNFDETAVSVRYKDPACVARVRAGRCVLCPAPAPPLSTPSPIVRAALTPALPPSQAEERGNKNRGLCLGLHFLFCMVVWHRQTYMTYMILLVKYSNSMKHTMIYELRPPCIQDERRKRRVGEGRGGWEPAQCLDTSLPHISIDI